MKKSEKIKEFLKGLEEDNSLDIDLNYHIDTEEIEDFSDIQTVLEESGAFNIDVIYYSVAIDYLKENDPSLKESLALASEMGFEIKNLNSETLASLLKSQNVREEFDALENEIDNFLEEVYDDIECGECGNIFEDEEEAKKCEHYS